MTPTRPLARPPASTSGDAPVLHVEIHPGVPAVAEISEEIDLASAAWLREMLVVAIRRHGPAIGADLRGVTFLDRSGVSMLLATARRARLEGGRMWVIRPSAQAWRLIMLLGLQDVLPRNDEQAEAVTVPRCNYCGPYALRPAVGAGSVAAGEFGAGVHRATMVRTGIEHANPSTRAEGRELPDTARSVTNVRASVPSFESVSGAR
ncbi:MULTISPECIES: STAS domain-containing protein [Streptomyces]|uniref:STAS domain-containing protein n=2 Tax=Streptomyces TaxID=1883 RepID=A0ABV9J3C3_9ACTN